MIENHLQFIVSPGLQRDYYITCAHSKFWRLSGWEDRGGGDKSIQFINFERVEWRMATKGGGGGGGVKGWVTTIFLPFSLTVLYKKCSLPVYFYNHLPTN